MEINKKRVDKTLLLLFMKTKVSMVYVCKCDNYFISKRKSHWTVYFFYMFNFVESPVLIKLSYVLVILMKLFFIFAEITFKLIIASFFTASKA